MFSIMVPGHYAIAFALKRFEPMHSFGMLLDVNLRDITRGILIMSTRLLTASASAAAHTR